jgi:cytochrome b561
MKKIFFLSLIFSFFLNQEMAFASIKKWEILADESKIEFFATQDKSTINGSFKKFSGEIFFDKSDLKNSKIIVDINLKSVLASFDGASEMLLEKDWFNAKEFPVAKFSSQKISKILENKFHVDGHLKLKNIELPLSFDFSFKEFSSKKAIAIAEFELNRSAFGVGSKDEKASHDIKDSIKIKFQISAR